MAKSPTTRVRVLSALVIAGVTYKPNAVLELPTGLAKNYVKEGQADCARAAVDYALAQGAEVVNVQPASDGEPEQTADDEPAA